jgi:phosphate starvation-inducible PhoH-like protein
LVEKKIILKNLDLLDLFGENEIKLKIIKSYYPKLKITLRGEEMFIFGEESLIQDFDFKFKNCLDRYETNNNLLESDIHYIFSNIDNDFFNQEVILHGHSGRIVRARTKNQKKMIDLSSKHDLMFVTGPAGTGKTYTSVALAIKALKNNEVKKIILTRPAVESGENLGFLPGDLKEKLDPYMSPLYDALSDMLPSTKLKRFLSDNIIEIAPLAFMRGRTLDSAFVILDEAQNATISQMKMFLTRMGSSAKFIITGDVSQIDLPKNQKSGLLHAINILNKEKKIGFLQLSESDVIRHKLVQLIIKAYNNE